MAGDICFVELKIRMRNPAEVLVWSVIISEVAVIGAVGYFRMFVPAELYAPVLHHVILSVAALGALLGGIGCWQIMLCQTYHRTLRQISETDGLTGIYTRARFFLDARKIDITRCSVLMIDVDRFKSINDTYGHQFGDEVLSQTASRLRATCPTGDILARYGGEEFIVCLPVTSTKTAKRCAERLRLAVGAVEVPVEDARIPVTISIGLASGAEGGSLDELIARADKALLMAKSSGRNKVVTDEELPAFDPEERVQRIRRTSRF